MKGKQNRKARNEKQRKMNQRVRGDGGKGGEKGRESGGNVEEGAAVMAKRKRETDRKERRKAKW